MNRRFAFRLATISSLTLGGFIGGIAYERNRYTSLLDQCSNPYLLHASKDIKKVRKFTYYVRKLEISFALFLMSFALIL